MTEDELKRLVYRELERTVEYGESDVKKRRKDAMDRYLGEKLGNEIKGRSQVVSRDLMETIEWLLPDLLNIFAASDDFVKFNPHGEEDEDQAEQETDYINHIFSVDNNGFLLMYEWFKDSLLKINGYVKAFWEESEKEHCDYYENLTDEQLTMLAMENPDWKVTEHEAFEGDALSYEAMAPPEPVMPSQGAPAGQGPPLPPDPNNPEGAPQQMMPVDMRTPAIRIPVQLHNIKIKRTESDGWVKIMSCPTDEIRISNKTRSIDVSESPFTAHVRRRTMSDLAEQGYSKKKLDNLKSGTLGWERAEGALDGFEIDDDEDEGRWDELEGSDKSRKEVWVAECFMLIDYNDDGKSELRKVVLAGDEILENEETDRNNLHALCPILLPHRHNGLGIDDLVKDVARIRTEIWRQTLDNIYLINNQRYIAKEGPDGVNLNDLLTPRPLQIIRTRGDVNASVAAVPTTELASATFPMFEMLDNLREARTGVGRAMESLDPNVLQYAKVGAIAQLLDRAHARVALIARTFAETGIKSLFLHIHELTRKHQRQDRVVKLRNKWETVNPAEWKERSNMIVNVGLGTGNREQVAGQLEQVASAQERLYAMDPSKIGYEEAFATFEKIVNNAGYRDASQFAKDPQEQGPQQDQGPTPEEEAMMREQDREDAKLQLEQQKVQAETQNEQMQQKLDAMQAQAEHQLAAAKEQREGQVAMKELMLRQQEMMQRHQEILLGYEVKFQQDTSKVHTDFDRNRIQERKQDMDHERATADSERSAEQADRQQTLAEKQAEDAKRESD